MFLKSFSFGLDLPDPDHQPPLRDEPKYAGFKGAENHSISSIDSSFCLKPPLFWQFVDILYRGEVGLAP
jgi:hypothetical protein